jgi:hemoglobin
MNSQIDPVRPARDSQIECKGVDRAFIAALVREFYRRVRANPRLGPIFAREITGDWEPHLKKMTEFWSSVILKTANYHGRPVPAHLKLEDVTEGDFGIWLDIFRQTTRDLCTRDVAAVFNEKAETIARSLQYAMFYRLPSALHDSRIA